MIAWDTMRQVLYRIFFAVLVASLVPVLLAVWGIMPWFGLGGQLMITLWIVGAIGSLVTA